MVNHVCNKCIDEQLDDPCDNCEKAYSKKEIIIAEADNGNYIHGDVFETTFYDKLHGWESIVGTQYRWKGKVKITIEQLEE